jgi:hypothetical protein
LRRSFEIGIHLPVASPIPEGSSFDDGSPVAKP